MRKSDTVTEYMLVKAFSEVGRKNYEVAVVPLLGGWLKKSLETTDLLELLSVESFSGYVSRKDHGASFLFSRKVPFYEQWFGGHDLTFLEARTEEIEQLCRHFHAVKSENLAVGANGLANYEAFHEGKLTTVDFDIYLIQQILTAKN